MANSGRSSKKRLFAVIKIVISAIAFYFAFQQIDFSELVSSLKKLHWGVVVLAITLYYLSQVISTYRLAVILKCLEDRVPFLWNLKLYLVGMAYNLLLPGGIGGDAYKVFRYSSRSGIPRKKYITALLGDRIIGLIGILTLLILLTPLAGFAAMWWNNSWIWILIPVGLVISYYLVKRFYNLYLVSLFPTLGLSIVVQLVQILAVVLIANQVAGSAAIDVAAVFLASTIATAIPVFLGGLGAREVVFGMLFPMLGYPPEDGVLIAVIFSSIIVVTSLPGLLISDNLPND